MKTAKEELFDKIGLAQVWVVFEPRSLTFPFLGAVRFETSEDAVREETSCGAQAIDFIVDSRDLVTLAAAQARSTRGVAAWARFLRRWLANKPLFDSAKERVWPVEAVASALRNVGLVWTSLVPSPRELFMLLENAKIERQETD